MDRHLQPLYYIDSNVFLSVTSDEHKKYARYFFSKLFENHFTGVVSSIVWEEINLNSPNIIDLPFKYWKKALPHLSVAEISDDALQLAKTYIESGIFVVEDFVSALNVAIASINRCHAFTSWDYRGIVNHSCYSQIKGINKLLGKQSLYLYTPAMI